MSPKTSKRVLRPGTASVLVGDAEGRRSFGWRLDVREGADGSRQFFSKRKRPGAARGRPKLFHYISAGGMRQLRRTATDDLIEDRQRWFLIGVAALAFLWLLFYVIPSVS